MHTNNKLSKHHQLQLLEDKKEEFNNFDQSELSNARKINTKQNKQEHKLFDKNSSNAVGLRNSLHGNVYQLKLLMLFLQTALDKNYAFELYSEEPDAEKFNDVIFKYGKDKNKQYRLLQAKHKLPQHNYSILYEITINDLYINSFNNIKSPFTLEKYFDSFRNFEQNEKYKNKIKDLIIYTNADLSNTIKNRFVKKEEPDDILNYGEQYQLIFEKNNDIVKILKDTDLTPELKTLATKLAEKVLKKGKQTSILFFHAYAHHLYKVAISGYNYQFLY